MIPALSINITGIGQIHRNCEKHIIEGQGNRICEKRIIADNSGTIHRRNLKLVPKYVLTS